MGKKSQKIRTHKLIIEKDNQGYLAHFPSLPGCFSYGKTKAEAQKNAAEALALYLETKISKVK